MTTTAVDFDEFVRDRSARLLRVAYLFTRDHALAEDLLQTTYARCWRSWKRIDGDPEPYVRRALVNTYNSWWRRKWNGELPSDDVPDAPAGPAPQEDVDARDEVWRALRKLPRQQQTVIVLRYFEDLTEAEIAEIMQVSAGAVKGYASKALTKLRRDPTLSSLPMPDAEPVPAASRRVAGVHDRIRRAQRVRLATAGTAILVILTLVAAFLVGLAAMHKALPHPVEPSPSTLSYGSDASYFDGKHIVAQLPPTPAGQPVAKLRWTPRPDHLAQLFFVCVRHGDLSDVVAEVWIGKDLASTVQCDHDVNPIPANWWRTWDFQAIDLDGGSEPVTFETRLYEPGAEGEPAKKTTDGSVAMIVVERSTMAEYLFPTPPAQLPAITRPADRNRHRFERGKPLTATVSLPAGFFMKGGSQGPGILHIYADGDEVGTLAWWDWEGEGRTQCHGAPGRTTDADHAVVITVSPENMQADWFVDIVPVGDQTCA